ACSHAFTGLRGFEAHQDATEPDLVVIVERRGRLGGQALAIEEGEIGTILILQHVLPILYKDASVQTRYSPLLTAVSGQVYIGVDVANGILAAHSDVIFPAQVKLLVVGLDDQPGLQSWRGC